MPVAQQWHAYHHRGGNASCCGTRLSGLVSLLTPSSVPTDSGNGLWCLLSYCIGCHHRKPSITAQSERLRNLLVYRDSCNGTDLPPCHILYRAPPTLFLLRLTRKCKSEKLHMRYLIFVAYKTRAQFRRERLYLRNNHYFVGIYGLLCWVPCHTSTVATHTNEHDHAGRT